MAYFPNNPNGQDTMANSQPVTIASDQSTVPVSLASVPSHAVTNAGTFAVQVTSAPTTAVTGTFWQATQPVSGTFWQATQPVSIASMPSTPVTGTFWQATQPVSWSGQTVAATQSGTWTVTQGAAGSTDWRSDLRRGATPVFAAISASSSGDNTLVAADGTRKIKVLQYTIISAGTVNTTFKSGAGTNLSGAMPLVANSGVASPFVAPGMGHLMETAVNQALVLNLSGAITVTGHLTYILEA